MMQRAAVFVALAVAAILYARRSQAAYQPAPFYAPPSDPARRMQENVYYPDAGFYGPEQVYFPDDNFYGPEQVYFPDDNLYDYPPAPVYEPEAAADDYLTPFQPANYEAQPMDANANLAAFLKMIRVVESRDNYRALVGGGNFDDFSDHPARKGWKGWNGSRAAGAYQIQPGTMKEAVKQAQSKGIIIPDFSPQSQDLMAVEILQFPWRNGAYRDVIAGNVSTAIQKLSLEWEAFQKMLAGQYPVTVAQARDIYARAGGGFIDAVA